MKLIKYLIDVIKSYFKTGILHREMPEVGPIFRPIFKKRSIGSGSKIKNENGDW